MAVVQKGNVPYTVPQESVKEYVKQGYDVLDEKTGEVVERTTVLTLENAAEKIAMLEKENEALRAENAQLAAAKK